MDNIQTVVCGKCSHEYPLQDNVKHNQLDSETVQYSIVCPNCDNSVHSYFDNAVLAASRSRMNIALERYGKSPADRKQKAWDRYKFQRETYSKLFREEQNKLRKKYRIPDEVSA